MNEINLLKEIESLKADNCFLSKQIAYNSIHTKTIIMYLLGAKDGIKQIKKNEETIDEVFDKVFKGEDKNE